MKILLTLVFSLFALTAFSHTGSGVAGGVTLNGILKSTLIKAKIPLGGISSFYGYEAIGFPTETPIYCYGGVGLSSGNSLIGISFGGQFNKIQTAGKCEKTSDYEGGFLSIGLNYDLKTAKSSSKSLGVQGAINLGFDLEKFNQKIISTFHTYSNSKRPLKKRMRDVLWHLVKYAGRMGKAKIKDDYIFKLLLLPMMPAFGADWKSAIAEMKIDLNELKKSQDKNQVKSLKLNLTSLFHEMKRDPGFYKCSGDDCQEIFVDAYYVMDAIEDSMGECHSLTLGLAPTASYDLKIPFLDSSFGYSFSYSFYGVSEIKDKNISTELAASKAFGKHRFHQKSASCVDIEKTAAGSFADFLSILGIAGK